jgi:hypothetical protein
MDLFTWNLIEAGFWLSMAVLVGGLAPRQATGQRTQAVRAAIWLAVFGLSDVAEAFTGAWWQPWWLMVIKMTCLGALFYSATAYLRRRRQITHSEPGS